MTLLVMYQFFLLFIYHFFFLYLFRYTLAGYNFPSGIGPNKDTAKRRAAGQALAVMQKIKVRGFYFILCEALL